jgi:hypothetical protein
MTSTAMIEVVNGWQLFMRCHRGLPQLIAPALGRQVVACRSPLRLPVHGMGCNSLRSGGPLWAAVLKCDTLGCPR